MKEKSSDFTPGWLAFCTFKKVTFKSCCFSILLKSFEGQCGNSEGIFTEPPQGELIAIIAHNALPRGHL